MGASCSGRGPKEAEQCMGVSLNQGYHFRGPHNKETFNILGSIWGSVPLFWETTILVS